MGKPADDTCVTVAVYNDLIDAFKIGQRWIVAGIQKGRPGGKTWQIILKPYAKKDTKK